MVTDYLEDEKELHDAEKVWIGGEIYQKIPLVMKDIKAIGKGQYNSQQGFKFRGIDDVYNHTQAVLAKHGVFTTPEIIGRYREQITTRGGSRAYLVVNNYRFRFYAGDGSFIDAWADGEAIDTGDKASNKAAAIAHKYALLQVLCIPTADLSDPDSESPQLGATPGLPDGTLKTADLATPPRSNGTRGPDAPASDAQIKMIYGKAKEFGLDMDYVARFCSAMFGVKKFNQLKNGQIQDVVAWMMNEKERK